jgi:hypothetical protein
LLLSLLSMLPGLEARLGIVVVFCAATPLTALATSRFHSKRVLDIFD